MGTLSDSNILCRNVIFSDLKLKLYLKLYLKPFKIYLKTFKIYLKPTCCGFKSQES